MALGPMHAHAPMFAGEGGRFKAFPAYEHRKKKTGSTHTRVRPAGNRNSTTTKPVQSASNTTNRLVGKPGSLLRVADCGYALSIEVEMT